MSEESITAREYAALATAREASPEYQPAPAVRPTPPAEMRPRLLPVTDLDRLFSDPFSVYARQILGLRVLKDIDAEPESSDFGTLIHRAIQALTLHWNEHQRAASDDELNAMAERSLRALSDRPNIDFFWRQRLVNGLCFVNAEEQKRRSELHDVAPEKNLEGLIGEMTVYGRLDRLESRDSGLTLVDYKSGKVPTLGELRSGKSLQLLAYAMLLGEAEALEYWQLPRLGTEGNITRADLGEGDLNLTEIGQKLEAALAQFLDPETPLLATPSDRNTDDYAGISRYDEWAG